MASKARSVRLLAWVSTVLLRDPAIKGVINSPNPPPIPKASKEQLQRLERVWGEASKFTLDRPAGKEDVTDHFS